MSHTVREVDCSNDRQFIRAATAAEIAEVNQRVANAAFAAQKAAEAAANYKAAVAALEESNPGLFVHLSTIVQAAGLTLPKVQ